MRNNHIKNEPILPPLNALKAFGAVADAGNISKAARTLGVTHGAVSRQIALLEDILGQKLFQRHSRGVYLSSAGKILAPYVLTGLENLTEGIIRLNARRPGEVSISALPSFTARWLLPRLQAFRSEHPEISLRLLTSLDLIDLNEGMVDLAIRYGHGKWDGLEAELLYRPREFPVCSRSLYQSARDFPATDVSLIHDSDEIGWERWFHRFHPDRKPGSSGSNYDDYGIVLQAVFENQGIALGREGLVEVELARGDLIRLGPSQECERAYYIVRRAGRRPNPAESTVISWLRNEIARMPSDNPDRKQRPSEI